MSFLLLRGQRSRLHGRKRRMEDRQQSRILGRRRARDSRSGIQQRRQPTIGAAVRQYRIQQRSENLKEILCALGMLDAGSDIDVCFTASETKLGFASVIRCGLGLETEPGEYATSGKVVRAAIASDSPVRQLFNNCTERTDPTTSPGCTTHQRPGICHGQGNLRSSDPPFSVGYQAPPSLAPRR
jgi:hypothetical protein